MIRLGASSASANASHRTPLAIDSGHHGSCEQKGASLFFVDQRIYFAMMRLSGCVLRPCKLQSGYDVDVLACELDPKHHTADIMIWYKRRPNGSYNGASKDARAISDRFIQIPS